MTLIDFIIEIFGEAPNDLILTLYYVLGIVMVIYFIKLMFSILRAVLGINGRSFKI